MIRTVRPFLALAVVTGVMFAAAAVTRPARADARMVHRARAVVTWAASADRIGTATQNRTYHRSRG